MWIEMTRHEQVFLSHESGVSRQMRSAAVKQHEQPQKGSPHKTEKVLTTERRETALDERRPRQTRKIRHSTQRREDPAAQALVTTTKPRHKTGSVSACLKHSNFLT